MGFKSHAQLFGQLAEANAGPEANRFLSGSGLEEMATPDDPGQPGQAPDYGIEEIMWGTPLRFIREITKKIHIICENLRFKGEFFLLETLRQEYCR